MRRLLSFFFIVPVFLLVAGHAAPSVLVCGGDMMKGDHFADSVLPVLRGAGAKVTAWDGGDPVRAGNIIAAAPGLHAEVMRTLAD